VITLARSTTRFAQCPVRATPLEVRPAFAGHDDFERIVFWTQAVLPDAGRAGIGGDGDFAGLRRVTVTGRTFRLLARL
jgi:hypothetical protein